jgi:Cytochrome P460
MNTKTKWIGVSLAALLVGLSTAMAVTPHDKYSLKVPGGLAFAEFKGYESWEVIATSQTDKLVAVIMGNPAMINAYKAGIPENGKLFPDGAKMAKIHWKQKKSVIAPGQPTVPGELHDVDFMVKDSKRFADSGGWGYAMFKFDAAAAQFVPGTLADQPPQGSDAKCGAACHTIVKNRDYVFTEYAKR